MVKAAQDFEEGRPRPPTGRRFARTAEEIDHKTITRSPDRDAALKLVRSRLPVRADYAMVDEIFYGLREVPDDPTVACYLDSVARSQAGTQQVSKELASADITHSSRRT